MQVFYLWGYQNEILILFENNNNKSILELQYCKL